MSPQPEIDDAAREMAVRLGGSDRVASGARP